MIKNMYLISSGEIRITHDDKIPEEWIDGLQAIQNISHHARETGSNWRIKQGRHYATGVLLRIDNQDKKIWTSLNWKKHKQLKEPSKKQRQKALSFMKDCGAIGHIDQSLLAKMFSVSGATITTDLKDLP